MRRILEVAPGVGEYVSGSRDDRRVRLSSMHLSCSPRFDTEAIHREVIRENRYAIAQVVLHGKEQLVLLRPQGRVLLMTVLDRENEVTKSSAFEEQAPKAEAPRE